MKQIKEFKNEWRFLSNFYYHKMVVDGTIHMSMEHYFQYSKTNNVADAAAILNAKTPGEAKRIGGKVELIENWDQIKDDIMLNGLRAKFSWPYLINLLEFTDGYELIEGNYWGDKYWGVCLKTNEGENKLGKLLMQVRDEINYRKSCLNNI